MTGRRDPLAFELTHDDIGGRPWVQLLSAVTLMGYTVPSGFRTDFASIPWWAAWAIPVFGRSCRAAVLHDYLCWIGVSRALRSQLFLQQMRLDSVPSWQAHAQYLAVRWWPGSETVTGEIIQA